MFSARSIRSPLYRATHVLFFTSSMMKRPLPAFGIRDLPTFTFLGQTEGLGTYRLVLALDLGRFLHWLFGRFASCARVVAVMLRVLLRFALVVAVVACVVIVVVEVWVNSGIVVEGVVISWGGVGVVGVLGSSIIMGVAGLAGNCSRGGVPYRSLISC